MNSIKGLLGHGRWAAVLFGVAAVIAGLAAAWRLPFRNGPAPRSEDLVRRINFHFPPSLPNRSVGHTFLVRDVWGHTLHLTRLEPTCVCTRCTLDRSTVAPGGAARLTFVILPSGYAQRKTLGATLMGQVAGRPVQFTYVFFISTTYPINFPAQSGTLSFGRMPLGAPPKTLPPLELTRGKLAMAWTRVTCSTDDPGLHASLRPTGAGRWRLEASYQPKRYLGEVVSHIVFTFWNHGIPLKYHMYRAIRVRVQGPVVISQPALLIGTVRPAATHETQLVLLPRNPASKAPIRLLHIAATSPSEFSFKPGGTAVRRDVEVGFTAKKTPGDDSGLIKILVRYRGRNYAFRVPYLAFVPTNPSKGVPVHERP